MSTIGLSFGSPTSGQGFDVSATVSQIVANLREVESPWQTQLTSLESQDTVLSSLGSDLSTLSSALTSLTDFEGVFSGKDGSSSDTSILQLTTAASTAIAGSYSVVVNKVAQTSTEYSQAIGATDTLATGGTLCITIGGTTQTLTIDSTNDTLSTLASAINAGTYGVSANVLSTSSGDELVLTSNTSGAAGQITLGGSITDQTTGSTLNFTQGLAGQDASLVVNGVPVTSASNTITTAIPGVTFQVLSADPNTTVQVEITNDNSSVESAVATFVSAYNTVVSAINAQEGTDTSGNAEPLYGNPTLVTLQSSIYDAITFAQPANAAATTTAIATTDSLSGSLSIQVGSGAATTFTLSSGETLSGLAAAINSASIGVTAVLSTSGSSSVLQLTNATSGTAGALTVDSSNLTDATTGDTVSFASQTNAVTSLSQLGISTNNDGTLSLDVDTLDSLLDSNYQDVMNFLEPSGYYTSFGGNLSDVIDNMGTAETTGVLSLALSSNSSTESQLETNISNEEINITAQQSNLTTELNEANLTLQEIPSEINEMNELYSAITGYNENSNG